MTGKELNGLFFYLSTNESIFIDCLLACTRMSRVRISQEVIERSGNPLNERQVCHFWTWGYQIDLFKSIIKNINICHSGLSIIYRWYDAPIPWRRVIAITVSIQSFINILVPVHFLRKCRRHASTVLCLYWSL